MTAKSALEKKMLKNIIHGQRKRKFHTPQEFISLKQQMHRELRQNQLGPAQQSTQHPALPTEGEKSLQLTKQTKQKDHRQ